jgi:hypothetical protein
LAPVLVSSPSTSPSRPPCAVAEALTAKAIEQAEAHAASVMQRLLANGKYKGRPLEGEPSYADPPWIHCRETPGGAWALVLVRAQLAPQSDYDWNGTWLLDGDIALVHIDREGNVVEQAVSTQAGASMTNGDFYHQQLFGRDLPNCCSFVFGGLDPLELFDFDGNGEPEVHVGASYGHEGVRERTDVLLRFHAGRITEYPGTQTLGFDAMKDETGDGRPELALSRGLLGAESCGSGFPADGRGLTFIAHSLADGTFSLDDAEARAYARQQCPAPPAQLTSVREVLCARLWGRAPSDLERSVRATTTAWDCQAEMAGRPQHPHARGEYQLMLSAAHTWVPFTLP